MQAQFDVLENAQRKRDENDELFNVQIHVVGQLTLEASCFQEVVHVEAGVVEVSQGDHDSQDLVGGPRSQESDSPEGREGDVLEDSKGIKPLRSAHHGGKDQTDGHEYPHEGGKIEGKLVVEEDGGRISVQEGHTAVHEEKHPNGEEKGGLLDHLVGRVLQDLPVEDSLVIDVVFLENVHIDREEE